jgi:uncharacterized protein (DUF58 family)
MNYHRVMDWLERHWVAPALTGWLILGLSLFFFGAATNTMAGWLYVISGVMFAFLTIAAILPGRSLHQLNASRSAIRPVYAGQMLTIEVVIENRHISSKSLVQLQDLLPSSLGQPALHSVELIPACDAYHWRYHHVSPRRGIYRWKTVLIRTAAPFGLFWRRCYLNAPAKAVVYPTVLPLNQCPLLDVTTDDIDTQIPRLVRARQTSEGLTRAMRPYRWGDPFRLIHWRTSARYGELRVRELEAFTTGQEIVIALDSANTWQTNWFEQAVIAAASMYIYSLQQNLQVSLWTAKTGLIQGLQVVLEALAATHAQEPQMGDRLPRSSVVWLTQNIATIETLPVGSRWLVWPVIKGDRPSTSEHPTSNPLYSGDGLLIDPDQPLQQQLQSPISLAR